MIMIFIEGSMNWWQTQMQNSMTGLLINLMPDQHFNKNWQFACCKVHALKSLFNCIIY